MLSFLALAGPTLALIRQPESGWGAPDVILPGLGGIAFLAIFLWREATTPYPMLPLELFKRRNFTAGNLQTFAMYAGLSVLFFYLILFLQQVAGYNALEAGFATLPTTVVLFLLSKRAGALADRYGARWFMGGGGLLAASGLLLLLRVDAEADFVSQLLPALLVFSVGLAATVAPLTATVLADADEEHAGIASGTNNAIARAAGLLGVAALGAVIAAQFAGSLDDRLAGVPLTPTGQAAVAEAKSRTLARADVSGFRRARRCRSPGPRKTPRCTRSTLAWGSAPRSLASAASWAWRSCAHRGARSAASTARAASSWPRRPTPCASARRSPSLPRAGTAISTVEYRRRHRYRRSSGRSRAVRPRKQAPFGAPLVSQSQGVSPGY